MDFCLNDKQRQKVEEYLPLLDKVIGKYIHINNSICGMEYDDIYQIGAIGLCKASVMYQENAVAKFETYAFIVIKNHIISYLKSILHKKYAGEKYVFRLQTEPAFQEMTFEEGLAMEVLQQTKERYSGTALVGIEVIELKMQGFCSREIAEKYHVKANYIEACVSRAKKYLRQDATFLEMLG